MIAYSSKRNGSTEDSIEAPRTVATLPLRAMSDHASQTLYCSRISTSTERPTKNSAACRPTKEVYSLPGKEERLLGLASSWATIVPRDGHGITSSPGAGFSLVNYIFH
jgi:hypothetical protein